MAEPDASCSVLAMQSPLKPAWDRVLQIGDASGIQSPLSFGGFGAMTRHLARLRQAILEALEVIPFSLLSRRLLVAHSRFWWHAGIQQYLTLTIWYQLFEDFSLPDHALSAGE